MGLWKRIAGSALLLAMGGGALAQDLPANGAQRVEVHLSSFHFTPGVISLRHGAPYVLVLVNDSGGGHNFSADRFFAASTVAAEDRAKLGKSGIDVGSHETVLIHLTAPAVGSYKLRCTHFMHSAFGMKGRIEVS